MEKNNRKEEDKAAAISLKMNGAEKAQHVAWLYFRMVERHIKGKNPEKIIKFDDWIINWLDVPWIMTKAAVRKAKQDVFYHKAIELISENKN